MSRILVVGAGMAGASAARDLAAAGHAVVVVDKGHVAGGRVSTRTVDGAVFDVGAQFLTAKSASFREQVTGWLDAGVVAPWFTGAPDASGDAPSPVADAHPRYRGTPTMRRLAEHATRGVDLRLGSVVTRVEAVEATDPGWRLHGTSRDGVPFAPFEADALVMTAPVPQVLALLDAGSVPLAPAHRTELERVVYDPCLTVLGIPRSEPRFPARGALRIEHPDIQWITDNQRSGASELPAVTIHASAGFSRAHFDAPRHQAGEWIADAAAEVLGTDVEVAHVHGWRYAAPRTATTQASVLDTATAAALVIAGDAFGGGRIEGAVRSGRHAALRLNRYLDVDV